MRVEVFLKQLQSTVNLVHFQTTEHLAKVLKDRTLFFQNVRRYSHEANILAVDSEFYSADTIGVFCFCNDMKAVLDPDMWRMYGTKGAGKSVCIGFWEAGAEAIPNTSGTLHDAEQLYSANRGSFINNH